MNQINVYDMLVFEDEASSIYQDCVCSITNDPVYIATNEDEIDEYFHTVICNNTTVHLDSDYQILNIVWNDINSYNTHTLKLKEIWTRTDEDTYKKVWED